VAQASAAKTYFMKKSVNQAKHGVFEPSPKSGNMGGNIGDDSDRFTHFCALLTERGFTGEQLTEIDNALTETGLRIVAIEASE